VYFDGFDGWIQEMRNGQEENKQLGLKYRPAIKISNDSEEFLKYWVDYFDAEGFDLIFTPTGGCSIKYKKRLIVRIDPPKPKIITFSILRSYKREYKRAVIEGLVSQNIRKYDPNIQSYILPWGKESFQLYGEFNEITSKENDIKNLIKEAVETVNEGKVLKVNKENHHILEDIFNGTYTVN
jgi:hypothetical protein